MNRIDLFTLVLPTQPSKQVFDPEILIYLFQLPSNHFKTTIFTLFKKKWFYALCFGNKNTYVN